jgi:hypothetical protein
MCPVFIRIFTVSAVLTLALPLAGQTAANKPPEKCVVPVAHHEPKPYRAEFKVTQVKTLGNGATITHEYTRIAARDSQKRTLFSTIQPQSYQDPTLWTQSNVHDPVAGSQTSWTSQSKKATVIKEPPEEQRHGCWESPSGHFTRGYPDLPGNMPAAQSNAAVKPASEPATAQMTIPKTVSEDLGTMTIQGIEARGQRHTTTIPSGAIGNDQPLVTMQEDWFSIEYGFAVRSMRDDPQFGKETTELVKLEPGEPDPVTFLPPEGYETVVEEMVPCKRP